MKKILVFVLSALLLCSCSKTQAPREESARLKMLTRDPGDRYISNTDDGYYEAVQNYTVGGYNIMYTDFATGKYIYLCNRPECNHNDESCPSYFGGFTQVSPLVNKSGNGLLCVARYKDEEDNVSTQLFSMNLDGSDRKMICDLGVDTLFIDHIVSSDNKIYSVISEPNFLKREVEKKMISIDLSTGERADLYTFENGESIRSAYGSKIYISRYDEDENLNIVEAIDLSTGERNEIYTYSLYELDGWKVPLGGVFIDNWLYTINIDNDTYERTNVDTGETETLVTSLSQYIDTRYSINLVKVMDNHIFLENVFQLDSDGNLPADWYAIDIATGRITGLNLEYKQYAERRVALPVACSEDDFLVIYGNEIVNVTLYGPGNAPYEEEAWVPKYGMISKSDFYNNVNNIRHIDRDI